MRFTLEHPVGQAGCAPELYRAEGLIAFVRAAEEAGFDAIAFTEHPAPSRKWLDHGGHASLDPLAALAFCAAATKKLRLLTYLMVLPYRNPLLLAKTVATVDQLSGGRLTLGVGSGYLRSEFATLGVEFEERGMLMDESLEVLRDLWAAESTGYSAEKRHFTARAAVSVPGPVQQPHPPIWLGGNGRAVRRRVAAHGQGWAPLLIGDAAASTTRSVAIRTPAELAAAVAELKELVADEGRDPESIDIQVQSPNSDDPLAATGWLERHQQHLGELAAAGVTWFVVRAPADDLDKSIDALSRYGRDVIAAQS